LAALGRNNALKLNFKMALRNGAKVEEIFEAIFQVAGYAGFAAAWDALEKLAEVLNEDSA
jgi:alkylhydroperoxidase/carboxymuconolactone decarboxylase family protein YurZ